MRIDLSAQEIEVLDALLESALRERQRQIHHAHSREFRRRLEAESERIEAIRRRLAHPAEAA